MFKRSVKIVEFDSFKLCLCVEKNPFQKNADSEVI
jgi:hypothetical protein